MKRNAVKIALLAVMAVFVSACSGIDQSKSVMFDVTTGDTVKITLDTSDGFDISKTVPFDISENEETKSQGTFIYASQFDEYVKTVGATEGAKISEVMEKDNIEYVTWDYNGEHNYAVRIIDSGTGILIGNAESRASADECFERLQFEIVD